MFALRVGVQLALEAGHDEDPTRHQQHLETQHLSGPALQLVGVVGLYLRGLTQPVHIVQQAIHKEGDRLGRCDVGRLTQDPRKAGRDVLVVGRVPQLV